MKKLISLFMAAAALSLFLCGCSFEYTYNNGKTVDGVYYVFNSLNKTCFAAQYQWDGKSTDIVIQDEVDGYKVTELGGYTGKGVPTPFNIIYEKRYLNEKSTDSSGSLLRESQLPESAVVHYINFDIMIGKYVNCIRNTDGFSDYQKIDKNNYIKPLVTFSVSPDNEDFHVNDLGMISYVKEGKTDDFDYASTHNSESYDQSKFYKLEQNDDSTLFKYYVFDTDGEIIDSDSSETEPSFWSVGDYMMQLSVQDGTGLSANHAKYYDLKNSKSSESFDYVLTAKDDYVVCADDRNGEHIIIVQDIFDKEKYYKEYRLENVSPDMTDFAVGGYFDEEGNIIITYLSGDDSKETDYAIVLSPD